MDLKLAVVQIKNNEFFHERRSCVSFERSNIISVPLNLIEDHLRLCQIVTILLFAPLFLNFPFIPISMDHTVELEPWFFSILTSFSSINFTSEVFH